MNTEGPAGGTGSAAAGPLEDAWLVRYRDPEELARLMAAAPDCPQRRVLEGFLAWREARPDEAVRLLKPLADGAGLCLLWVTRARSMLSAVLDEIGLVEESHALQLQVVEDSRALGDVPSLSAAVHDLGSVYQYSDPDQAVAQFWEGLVLARSYRGRSPALDAESGHLEALATLNLHEMHDRGTTIPAATPTLEQAEAIARTAWPDLAAAIRAQRALAVLEGGDVAAAAALIEDLPEPEEMRDVTHAANVVRARAQVLLANGQALAARDLIRPVLQRLPERFQNDLVEVLVPVNEAIGDLPAALEAAKLRADLMAKSHFDESRAAIRALEMWTRTVRAEEKARAAESAAEQLRRRMEELHRDRELLRARSDRDVLTGLWNRQRLDTVLGRLPRPDGHQVAVVDVDRFKEINDSAGHSAGDDALRRFADALRDVCDADDTLVRFGGDEFVVLRPAGVPGLLEDDLAQVARLEGHMAVGVVPISASIGVAWTTVSGFQGAFDSADRRMYQAKNAGGGAVVGGPPGTGCVELPLPVAGRR